MFGRHFEIHFVKNKPEPQKLQYTPPLSINEEACEQLAKAFKEASKELVQDVTTGVIMILGAAALFGTVRDVIVKNC